MSPHVVEFAPRLMPLQVDDGGGALLARIVGELGVTVHTPACLDDRDEGRHDGGVTVTLSDDTAIDAALLVFAAGVRPRTSSPATRASTSASVAASSSTPPVAVSIPTSTPSGRSRAVDGRCYGLVAPGYSTAEIVADRLVGG